MGRQEGGKFNLRGEHEFTINQGMPIQVELLFDCLLHHRMSVAEDTWSNSGYQVKVGVTFFVIQINAFRAFYLQCEWGGRSLRDVTKKELSLC
jgi:hypothetical protein